jgi:hypothetical protein
VSGGIRGDNEFAQPYPNGAVRVVTAGTQRLAILGNGAWSIGTDLISTGTSGYVLTSTGATTAPTWQAAGGSGALGNATVLGTTANSVVSITGVAGTSGSATMTLSTGASASGVGNNMVITAGASSGTGGSISILAGSPTAGNNGGDITLTGGAPASAGGNRPGNVTISSGAVVSGAFGMSNTSLVTLRGGDSAGNSANGGSVVIRGGNASNNALGGNLTISGGTGVNGGGSITFQTATTTSLVAGLTISNNRNVSIGQATLATTATNGFPYIPTCAGVPTGVPTSVTGFAPMVIDSTNNKLYFYAGGSWRLITST